VELLLQVEMEPPADQPGGERLVIMLVEEGYAMFSAWIHEDDVGFLFGRQAWHHAFVQFG